jgi:hypothetical protein
MSQGKLPNCEKAQIADAKLYKYLLNQEHPDGRGKAKFYEHIGYTPTNGEELRAALLSIACSGSIINALPNPEGTKYMVVGSIESINRKRYELLTVSA